jgi:hypothetical protein
VSAAIATNRSITGSIILFSLGSNVRVCAYMVYGNKNRTLFELHLNQCVV